MQSNVYGKMEHLFKIIIGAILLISLAACGDKQGKQISAIIPLAESNPDSALKALSKIDQIRLSDKDMALYALVYTMAQDKSGIDVDNDSLLRYAYNWYKDKPSDSLYAKCEYYMGRYYVVSDSSEKALKCFDKSINAAKKQGDNYTQSMGLFQASRIIREYNPKLALRYAKETIAIYNNVKNGSKTNKVYALLNLAECQAYNDDSVNNGLTTAKQALKLALRTKDSIVIANTYQDLSVLYSMRDEGDSALLAAKCVCSYSKHPDISAINSLAQAFYDTDSLKRAKEVLNSFKEKDPERKYAAATFSLLRLISAKEHDVEQTSRYADSVEVYQEKEIESISETKDRYYTAMLQKEELRKKFQNESQMKTVLQIVGICFSVLIIAIILYITWLKQKHTQIIHQEKQHQQQLELEHKERQITTMREFMMKKINIIQKLTSIQSNKNKHVLLSDSDWEELGAFLNSSDNEFIVRLTNEFPLLTKKDIRFLMLIRIRLPYQIIAQILSIEPKSVRQRLFLIKAKLGLKSNQQSTKKFIEDY